MAEVLKRSAALFAFIFSCAACGAQEAQPSDMREAATACGIASFEVAATRDANQSPYALHYVAEGDRDRSRLDCYKARLEARGLRSTLAMGSTGELKNDDALLFARVSESCRLPASAMITQRAGQPINTIVVYGAGAMLVAERDCTVQQLRESRRFEDIQFSSDSIPARPTIRF